MDCPALCSGVATSPFRGPTALQLLSESDNNDDTGVPAAPSTNGFVQVAATTFAEYRLPTSVVDLIEDFTQSDSDDDSDMPDLEEPLLESVYASTAAGLKYGPGETHSQVHIHTHGHFLPL